MRVVDAPRLRPTCDACGLVAASRRALREGLCGACRERRERERARHRSLEAIRGLLGREDVLLLDTETTGLRGAEVIEIGVIDACGTPLLDTLVRPRSESMNPHAERVHGIKLEMLEGQPTWPEVLPELHRLAERATVLAWNASFDARMLAQSSAAWGLEHPRWLFGCAMKLYSGLHGTSRYGLQKAVAREGLQGFLREHRAHRALGDARLTLEVLRSAANGS